MKMKNVLKFATMLIFITNCNILPAQSYLDINNVKALINNEGSLFYNFKDSLASYEVPKGLNKHTIFSSTLWIGGYDAGNNLHEAAQTYRQDGTDYWAGPLDTVTLATDTAGWQKTWKINKSTIDYHRKNYFKSGYVVPTEIQDWPANGKGSYAKVLAPYIDVDSNKQYNPAAGDFPYIFGDQAVYVIYNDTASKHLESKAYALGIEIHAIAYAFNKAINGVSLNNTVFVRYEIKNRSNQDYHDLYAGVWTDFDIGNPFDDYIGSDSSRNMYFAYNGDTVDEGLKGYGSNPPAQCIKFLNYRMNHFMYYNNDISLKGNPYQAIHYYYYLTGRFKNGQKLRYGGDGFYNVWDAGRYENYMFPSDPRLAKPSWNEGSSGNIPGDRRGLGSIGPLNLKSGDVFVIDIAYIYARAPHTNYLDVFDDLYAEADQVQQLYNQGKITDPFLTGINDQKAKLVFNMAPNPMESYTVISFNNPENKDFNIQISDLYGKNISQKQNIKSGNIRLGRDDMKPGVYLVTLSNEKSKGQLKLIVK
jgi:hypothetical protein